MIWQLVPRVPPLWKIDGVARHGRAKINAAGDMPTLGSCEMLRVLLFDEQSIDSQEVSPSLTARQRGQVECNHSERVKEAVRQRDSAVWNQANHAGLDFF